MNVNDYERELEKRDRMLREKSAEIRKLRAITAAMYDELDESTRDRYTAAITACGVELTGGDAR